MVHVDVAHGALSHVGHVVMWSCGHVSCGHVSWHVGHVVMCHGHVVMWSCGVAGLDEELLQPKVAVSAGVHAEQRHVHGVDHGEHEGERPLDLSFGRQPERVST